MDPRTCSGQSYRRSGVGATLARFVLCMGLMARPAFATANDRTASAHCRELLAAAESSALVLRTPQLQMSAVRPPKVGDVSGTGIIPGDEFQLRTALSWPALDVLKGNSTVTSAEAECDRWLAQEEVERLLEQGTSFGQTAALKAQIDVLSAGLPRIEELLSDAQQRLDRGIITVLDRDDLRLRKLKLGVTLADLKHDLALLESQAPATDSAALGPAVQRYETASQTSQQEQSFQRKLTAWRLDVQAGGIPYPQPDWYGMVAVSWNFGNVGQYRKEGEALAAGAEDLRTSRNELRSRAERFTAAMRDSAARLNEELSLLDQQLAFIDERVNSPDARSDRMRQAVASFEVERLELQGRRAYVEKLLAVRSAAGRALE